MDNVVSILLIVVASILVLSFVVLLAINFYAKKLREKHNRSLPKPRFEDDDEDADDEDDGYIPAIRRGPKNRK